MRNKNIEIYLRENKDKFAQDVLKEKLLDSGYPLKEIEGEWKYVYGDKEKKGTKRESTWYILGTFVPILGMFMGILFTIYLWQFLFEMAFRGAKWKDAKHNHILMFFFGLGGTLFIVSFGGAYFLTITN